MVWSRGLRLKVGRLKVERLKVGSLKVGCSDRAVDTPGIQRPTLPLEGKKVRQQYLRNHLVGADAGRHIFGRPGKVRCI